MYRRRQCVTLKAVCTTFGEQFTSAAILPLFMASATLAAYLPEGAASPAVASAAEGLTPQVRDLLLLDSALLLYCNPFACCPYSPGLQIPRCGFLTA